MVMKNNTFVRLPVSEAAKSSWDTFAVERRDAVWRHFDASFKGILTNRGDKTYCHRTGRRVAHLKSAQAHFLRTGFCEYFMHMFSCHLLFSFLCFS